jgi:uncharacterized OB-fold protein
MSTTSVITDVSAFEATFLQFIAARELPIARWTHNGEILSYATRAPAANGARNVTWSKASGAATLHSFTVYHRQYHPDFPVPYVVAMVELAEGPQLVSTITNAAAKDLRVGMPLIAVFEPSGRLVFHAANTRGLS